MKFYLYDCDDHVLVFAASELQKYLDRIAGLELTPAVQPDEADFLLGGKELPENKWDDAILLKSRNGKLHIAGSNARSVLFAVYDFLETLGCRWTAPASTPCPPAFRSICQTGTSWNMPTAVIGAMPSAAPATTLKACLT